MKTPQSKYGFTLIELMVVVAIIGILMAAGILTFTNAQMNSRDAARIANADAVSKLMEQYYQENGQYFSAQNSSTSVAWTAGQVYTNLLPYLAGRPAPVDPKNDATYFLMLRSADRATSGDGTTTFCVQARLENTTNGKANCTITGAGQYSCPFTTTNPTHYCVENRQ